MKGDMLSGNESAESPEDSDGEFAHEMIDNLRNGRITLHGFLEQLGPQLRSDDRSEQISAMLRITKTLTKLPRSLLQWPDVGLLINFLLNTVDDQHFSLVITTVRYMLVNSPKGPNEAVSKIIVQLYCEQQVQELGQEDRCVMYEIMEYLFTKYIHVLQALGGAFIAYFISSVSGERDPRCLLMVFRLFTIVCKNLSIGPFASDLFDIVACYYPIEYKRSKKNHSAISKEMLVNCCECCLLAHPSFAPFVYQLIGEKLIDDETTVGTKMEICTFLAKACETFTADRLFEQIDDILGGIRTVVLSLANGGGSKKFRRSQKSEKLPEKVILAMQAIVKTLCSHPNPAVQKERMEHILEDLTENCEPFVLQVTMGMSEKMLALFEILARADEDITSKVINQVFQWLLLICSVRTIKSESKSSGLAYKCFGIMLHWLNVAADLEQGMVINKYRDRLLDIFDKAVDIRRAEEIAYYKLLEICLSTGEKNDSLLARYRIAFDVCLKGDCDISEELRNQRIAFMRAYAVHEWGYLKDRLESFTTNIDFDFLCTLLCSLVHDEDSMLLVFSRLFELFPSFSGWSANSQQNVIDVFRLNNLSYAVQKSAFLRFIELSKPECTVRMATFFQELGLALNQSVHKQCMSELWRMNDRSTVLPIFYLCIAQIEDEETLQSFANDVMHAERALNWQKIVLTTAYVNKTTDRFKANEFISRLMGMLCTSDKIRLRGRFCSVLLLLNDREGFSIFYEILRDILEGKARSGKLVKAAIDAITFDRSHSDPVKCKYKSTVLWRQRLFCQLVPILIMHVNKAKEDCLEYQRKFYELIPAVVKLGNSVETFVSDQYMNLLPVVIDLFDYSPKDVLINSALSFFETLLKRSHADDLDESNRTRILMKIETCLRDNRNLAIQQQALDCIFLLVKRWQLKWAQRFEGTLLLLIASFTGSPKRLIRKRAAQIRNMWELKA